MKFWYLNSQINDETVYDVDYEIDADSLQRSLHCDECCTAKGNAPRISTAPRRSLHREEYCAAKSTAPRRVLRREEYCTAKSTAPRRVLHREEYCTAKSTAPRRVLHCEEHCTAKSTAPRRVLHREEYCTAKSTAPRRALHREEYCTAMSTTRSTALRRVLWQPLRLVNFSIYTRAKLLCLHFAPIKWSREFSNIQVFWMYEHFLMCRHILPETFPIYEDFF